MNAPPESEIIMTVPLELENAQLIQLLINYTRTSVALINAISLIFNKPDNLPRNFVTLNFNLPNWNIERNEIKSILHFMIWKIFGATEQMLDLLYKPYTDNKSKSFTRLSQAKFYLSRNEMFPPEKANNIPAFNENSNYGGIAKFMYSALLSLREVKYKTIINKRKREHDEFNSTFSSTSDGDGIKVFLLTMTTNT